MNATETKTLLNTLITLEGLISGDDIKFLTKHKLLFLIYNNEIISPTTLRNITGLKKSNIASSCHELINDGLIDVFVDENDKRINYYKTTNEGNVFIQKLLDDLLIALNSKISTEELKKIILL